MRSNFSSLFFSSAVLWSCFLLMHLVTGWQEDPQDMYNDGEEVWNAAEDGDTSERRPPVLTLQGVGWWMAVGMKNAKGRPVANLYEVRKKNSQNTLNNKNSMHRRFSFGIGKRGGEGGAWLEDDDGNWEYKDSLASKRGKDRYSFGLGKREIPAEELLAFQQEVDAQKKSGKFSFGLGKRDNALEDDKRSKSYSFGLGKRFDDGVKRAKNGMYSFGLGKREIDEDDLDNMYLFDRLENSEDVDKRNRNFNFGLGKRLSNDNDEFVPDDDAKRAYSYSFGLGKRGKSYSFGLGKRDRGGKMYGFGLGKREEEPQDDTKRNKMYGFGLGKREDKKSKNYSFGLGKRVESSENNSDDASKRSRPSQYSFGLGKRDTTAESGSSATAIATSNDNALLTHEA